MPDPRSVMQEFRFLDQKRQAEGLTDDEEVRFGELRDLVGAEATAPKSRPGFNVTAAAARLRESLMPAGLRNRPPPEPEPAPEPFGEIEPPAPEPVAEAYAEQPYAAGEAPQQASEAFFDPQALAAEGEGAYDPNAAYYDPNAVAYDPNAAAYDPNAAAYDPNAAAYDPNAAAYDPNAAAYDPNAAAYDPNAAAYDPNAAAYDPNAAAYDPNAAAYDPNAAPYERAAYDPNAAPYDPNAAAYDPNAAAYDPNAAAYDPNAAAYDPNAAPYDPNAAAYDPSAAAYDPSAAAYDPNAAAYDPSAAAYDPNAAAYDPNAAAYDPNAAAYDPNAAAYDPNAAAYDPNAAACDPNAAPYDPNAAALDPNAAGDPGAVLTFEAGEAPPPEDPNAMGWADAAAPEAPAVALDSVEPAPEEELAPIELDGFAAPAQEESDWSGVSAELSGETAAPAEGAAWAPAPGGEYDAAAWDGGAGSATAETTEPAAEGEAEGDLSPFPPAGWAPEAEPPAAPEAPVEFGSYDDPAPPAPAAGQGELEGLLPFDPAAEAAVGPEMAHAFAGEELELPAPHDVPDHTGFHASEGMASQDAPGWQPEPAAIDQGFELASGGSFDASADAAAPEWAAPAAPAPWDAPEAEVTDALPGGAPYDPAGHEVGAAELSPAEGASGAALLDYSGGDLTPPEAEGLDLSWASQPAAPAAAAEPDAFEVLESPEVTQPGIDLTQPADVPLDLDAPSTPEAAPELDPLPPEEDIPTIEADDLVEAEPMADAAPAVDLAALEPELPVVSEHLPDPELPVIEEHLADADLPAAEPPLADPEPLFAAPSEPAEPYAAAPSDAYASEPSAGYAAELPPEPVPQPGAEYAAAAPAFEEPPLEIIETTPESEIPPPAPEYRVPGARRVVVHTMEGQVKRGVLEDADLAAPELLLAAVAGGPVEGVPTDHVKAIFFMLAPGESPVTPYGNRVRVTFRDGRPLAGLSPDYRDGAFGFFVIPADPRTSTERIWVYQAAVKQVAVS